MNLSIIAHPYFDGLLKVKSLVILHDTIQITVSKHFNEYFQIKIKQYKMKQRKRIFILLIITFSLNAYSQSRISDIESVNNIEPFEIPSTFLNKPILLINKITGYPNKLFHYGSASMTVDYSVILRFEEYNGQLKIIQQQYQNDVDIDDIIKTSVKSNHFDPIISFIPIESKTKSGIKINPDFFKNNIKLFSPIGKSTVEKFQLEPFLENSIILNNIELSKNSILISRTLNYTCENSPEGHYSDYVSIEQLLAFMILPENQMQRRKWNPCVGNFYLSTKKYDSEQIQVKEEMFIEKWRLEPEDSMTYFNGHLTRPKKPIVFYMDDNIPIKWRKYIKQGVLDWLPVFEKIGFKDAIEVHDKPKNAKWNDNDPNYNMIRWVASEIEDAQGDYITDPRTGEILNATLILYQSLFSSYNDECFVMLAAVEPSVRKPILPDSIFGELVRVTMTHEMGHALNLGHNMIASSSYITDSLRSKSFLERYSLSSSIMDYATYNYVAQPEDMPLPLIGTIGPYDYWAIKYAYKNISHSNGKSEMEIPYANNIIEKYLQNNDLQYMEQEYSQTIDYTNSTNDLGNNPILAGHYGLKNLKRIMPHIVEWSLPEDGDAAILMGRYKNVIIQADNIFRNVTILIGGEKRRLTTLGYTCEFVNSETIIKSIDFISENLFNNISWLYNEELEKLSKDNLYLASLEKLQTNAIKRILTQNRLLRLIEYDIKNNTSNTATILNRMNEIILKKSSIQSVPLKVQKFYVDRIKQLIEDSSNEPILNSLLQKELLSMNKILDTKLQQEKNSLIKGFYIELTK